MLFVVNLALGQSVTITPADASQTTIRKFGGTATLRIVGAGESGFGTGTTGNSEISLSNMTYLGASATSSIKFNNVYSIKNTYTPNLAGEENTFGMFYNTTPFFAFNPYSTVLETVPISVSHTASNTLSLANSTALGNNVKNEIFFKTGSYFTGAIKTIGTSASFARMGFFTYTDQSSNNLVERLSIIDGGNVGIGTTTPQTALHVIGNVRSSNLAGTGSRQVFADVNGTLTTDSQTNYLAISPSSFQPRYNNSGTFIASDAFSDCNMSVGSTDDIITGINLPHGATITAVELFYINRDNTKKFQCYFSRSGFGLTSSQIIVNAGTSLVSASSSDIKSIIFTPNSSYITVDNSSFSYKIILEVQTTAGVSSTWSADMSIKGIKITYTL